MEELFNQVVMQSPNFIGFIVGYWVLIRLIRAVQSQNDRLIDAIIKRENCPEVLSE